MITRKQDHVFRKVAKTFFKDFHFFASMVVFFIIKKHMSFRSHKILNQWLGCNLDSIFEQLPRKVYLCHHRDILIDHDFLKADARLAQVTWIYMDLFQMFEIKAHNHFIWACEALADNHMLRFVTFLNRENLLEDYFACPHQARQAKWLLLCSSTILVDASHLRISCLVRVGISMHNPSNGANFIILVISFNQAEFYFIWILLINYSKGQDGVNMDQYCTWVYHLVLTVINCDWDCIIQWVANQWKVNEGFRGLLFDFLSIPVATLTSSCVMKPAQFKWVQICIKDCFDQEPIFKRINITNFVPNIVNKLTASTSDNF